jgi:hypothetical protein
MLVIPGSAEVRILLFPSAPKELFYFKFVEKTIESEIECTVRVTLAAQSLRIVFSTLAICEYLYTAE